MQWFPTTWWTGHASRANCARTSCRSSWEDSSSFLPSTRSPAPDKARRDLGPRHAARAAPRALVRLRRSCRGARCVSYGQAWCSSSRAVKTHRAIAHGPPHSQANTRLLQISG
eukprot:scaffold4262_cov139-Isochrysis_galbana.AAC.2